MIKHKIYQRARLTGKSDSIFHLVLNNTEYYTKMFTNFNSWIKKTKTGAADKSLLQLFDSVKNRQNKTSRDYITRYQGSHSDWKPENFSIGLRGLLHHACGTGNLSVVKTLTDEFNFPIGDNADFELEDLEMKNVTPFYVATAMGYLSVVAHLIKNGAEINCSTNLNIGETALISACKTGNLDMVQFLIESGASIDLAKKGNVSPLMVACENEHADVVKLLVEYGADFHSFYDVREYSAAYYCVTNKSSDVIDFLLKQNPEISCYKTESGENLLNYAAMNGSDCVIDYIMQNYVAESELSKFVTGADKIEFLDLVACSKLLKKTFSQEALALLKLASELRVNLEISKTIETPLFEFGEQSEFESISEMEKAFQGLNHDFVQLQVFLMLKRILGLNNKFTIHALRNYLRHVNDSSRFSDIYIYAIDILIPEINDTTCSYVKDLVDDHATFCGTVKKFTINEILTSLNACRDLVKFYVYQTENSYGEMNITEKGFEALLTSVCRFVLAFLSSDQCNQDIQSVPIVVEEIFSLLKTAEPFQESLLRLILDPSSYKVRMGKRIADYPSQTAIQLVVNASKIDSHEAALKQFSDSFEKLCTSKQRAGIYKILGGEPAALVGNHEE